MTGMLASVSNIHEADKVVSAGVDILDLKQPASGALGRLEDKHIAEICKKHSGSITLSATIGDVIGDTAKITSAITDISKHDIDIIKVGIFSNTLEPSLLKSLLDLNQIKPIVLVLLVDKVNPLSILKEINNKQVYGVMLDTADKSQNLLQTISLSSIAEFITQAKSLKLLTGLAGSLNASHIPCLLPLSADYLGFRGALCCASNREQSIDELAVRRIRSSIRQSNNPLQLLPIRNQ